jgi:hypothetical protein
MDFYITLYSLHALLLSPATMSLLHVVTISRLQKRQASSVSLDHIDMHAPCRHVFSCTDACRYEGACRPLRSRRKSRRWMSQGETAREDAKTAILHVRICFTAPVSTAPVSTAPVSTAPVSTAPVSTAPVSTAPVSASVFTSPFV